MEKSRGHRRTTVLATPAAASAQNAPPGGVKSDNLDYVSRIAGARYITEGKFDRVRGSDILVVTGRFGFKTYDVSDPANPASPRRVHAPGHRHHPAPQAPAGRDAGRRPARLLAGRGHGVDRSRNLIIGALDPRHNDVATRAARAQHE